MKRAVIGMFLVPLSLIAQQIGAIWVNIGPSSDAVEPSLFTRTAGEPFSSARAQVACAKVRRWRNHLVHQVATVLGREGACSEI